MNTKYEDTDYKVIIYDGDLPYMARILSCIKQLTPAYFIITHENDILIKFDEKSIRQLLYNAIKYNIDYVDLKHDVLNKPDIPISDTLFISKIRDDEYYKFSVQPSLWNKESAIRLYSKFSDKTYQGSECDEVQQFMKPQKIYTLFSKKSLISLFFNVTPEYCFMRITQGGTLSPLREDNELEAFIQEEHVKIYNIYLNKSKRTQSPTAHSIQKGRIK